MKVLVTGGAGFIGSHFIRFLLRHHPRCTAVNLDLLTYAAVEGTVTGLGELRGHRLVRADISDRAAVERLMSIGFDAVVHFAAESHVDRSITGPDRFVATNIVGTHTLLEAARRAGVRRFVQVSSDEVYGSIPEGESAGPLSPLRPSNPYAASKAGGDLLVEAAFKTYGFPAIITRCTNNYGPFQHPEKFIPRLTICALRGEPLPVYGDGRHVRDWIHVEDHCRALDAILMAGVPGRVYTLSAGTGRQNIEVAKRILALAGAPGATVRHVEDRPGHDRRYALDDTVTREEFDWRPAVAFDRGLAETVAWYREHPEWWAPVFSGEVAPGRAAGSGSP